jgi:2-polyprenyl-6-methoxyphenol hydroxylase-like FAD-dependent oxidoreductase
MAKYKIAIIGAGPAGCTLARLLLHKKVNVDVTIFEGEKGLNARTQGGTLDLHTESGIKALKECGLYDDFIKLARFDAEGKISPEDFDYMCTNSNLAFHVVNKWFQSFIHFQGAKDANSMRGRPEIDRIQLRQLLLNALPEGLIHWDHHLKTIEEIDGTYHLNFRDRPSETGFDLVVGGDGCWSHVRTLLADQKPHYSGISGVAFLISKPKERCPELYDRVNRGSLFSIADHKSLMAQQLGSGSINVSYWGVHPEDWIKQFDGRTDDIEHIKRLCLEQIPDWDPRLRSFIELADGNVTPRSLYMLPVGNTWQSRPGVTLLGDAAHVMTPFAGEGVNLAMTDAMQLATSIEKASNIGTIEALAIEIKAYEEDMFIRAKKVQQMTYNMMSASLLDEGGLDRNIEKYIVTAAADEMPWALKPLFSMAAKAYFAVWRWRNPPPKQSSLQNAE